MKKWLHDNGLAVVTCSIFIVALVAMSVFGWVSANEELQSHSQSAQSYVEYLGSGEFIEAVFENWESEFLQMWALVVLTIWLRQKGSEDSKKVAGKDRQDTRPRYRLSRARNWPERARVIGHGLYSHSLGLALFAIFAMSFALHAVGGAMAYNDEQQLHGGQQVSTVQYVGTSRFWFESMQNWQSEFLAVFALLVLSIYLRERGSPESKPVGRSYDKSTEA